jgi:hypothetical protein
MIRRGEVKPIVIPRTKMDSSFMLDQALNLEIEIFCKPLK